MVSQTVSEFVVQRLHQWGVRHIFGYPGDGINGVFGAMNRAERKLGFVQGRHEEMREGRFERKRDDQGGSATGARNDPAGKRMR